MTDIDAAPAARQVHRRPVYRMPVAEFITLRQACGLTQQEAGQILGAALRTVQHWEAGRNAVPKSASDGLKNLDDLIRAQASLVLEPLARLRRPPADPVALLRYRSPEGYAGSALAQAGLPFPAHVAFLWRIMDGLSRLGIRWVVRWYDEATTMGEEPEHAHTA